MNYAAALPVWLVVQRLLLGESERDVQRRAAELPWRPVYGVAVHRQPQAVHAACYVDGNPAQPPLLTARSETGHCSVLQ